MWGQGAAAAHLYEIFNYDLNTTKIVILSEAKDLLIVAMQQQVLRLRLVASLLRSTSG